MYFYLTEQIQTRFVEELRTYWRYHPKYKNTEFIEHIGGKYSFRERGQCGIILQNSSGNNVQMAADNFMGNYDSYVQLAPFEPTDKAPGISIEWVRENAIAIQDNEGVFPSPPGIYYIELCDEHGKPSDCEFMVDPLLDVSSEALTHVSGDEWQISAGSFVPGTLGIWRMPGNIQLLEGVDYSADPQTGIVTAIVSVDQSKGEFLSADYRYAGETTGPWKVNQRTALIEPIPGAVLAFGQRITPGDKLAVQVTSKRSHTGMIFGGRWDLSLDMEVYARDVISQREILDQTAMYLWGVARSKLSTEGIELLTISLGGESEEIYDETGDDSYYTASLSLSVQTEWQLVVPTGATVRRVEPGVINAPDSLAQLTDEEIARLQTTLIMQQSLEKSSFDPFLAGKAGRPGVLGTFPMIR